MVPILLGDIAVPYRIGDVILTQVTLTTLCGNRLAQCDCTLGMHAAQRAGLSLKLGRGPLPRYLAGHQNRSDEHQIVVV